MKELKKPIDVRNFFKTLKLPLNELIDVVPIPAVCRDPPRTDVRLIEIALLLEYGHIIPNRSRRRHELGSPSHMG